MSLEKILSHYKPSAPISRKVLEAEQNKDYGKAAQLCYYEKYYFRSLRNLSKEVFKILWKSYS